MKKLLFYLFASGLFLFVIDCGEATPQQAVIKINPQQKFQKMSGWEATAQAGESYSPAFEKYKEELFNQAVNNLGINRLRLEVRSGAENPQDFFTAFDSKQISEQDWKNHYYEVINDNDDPFLINTKGFQFSELDSTIERIILPIKKLLAERNESLFVNLNYVDFKMDWRSTSNIRHQDDPEEYAEFILAVYQHMKSNYGFVPDAVEVILEPDTDADWKAEEIGKAMVATAARLQANDFTPSFIVPSTTNAANAPVYIDEIAKVPGALNYVSEFSYHRYRGGSSNVLQQIANRAEKYGKQTAMLELIGADYNTLHQDLKVGRNSAWQQYTLAFPYEKDNGAQYFMINDKNPNDQVVSFGDRTKFLRQYFRYIRSGAQRIGSETSNPNFDPLAFINTDGKYVLVVKTDVPGTITIEGIPSGIYGITYTTSTETDVKMPDVSIKEGESLKANIPSAGVITVFGGNSSV